MNEKLKHIKPGDYVYKVPILDNITEIMALSNKLKVTPEKIERVSIQTLNMVTSVNIRRQHAYIYTNKDEYWFSDDQTYFAAHGYKYRVYLSQDDAVAYIRQAMQMMVDAYNNRYKEFESIIIKYMTR